MGNKVTLKALDHLLMASIRHREGKYKEAAKHLQLASEQEDYEDTMETLNAANEEGWDDDEEVAADDIDMSVDEDDLDLEVEDDEEVAAEDDTEDDVDLEDEDATKEVIARLLARVSRQRSKSKEVAEAEVDESSDEEDSEAESVEASIRARHLRAQANLKALRK